MDKAQDFLVDTVIDDEVELLEPEIVMTVDKAGRNRPMACSIIVVKSIQRRACSKLLRVLNDSGGSKSIVKTNILPKGVRLNTDGPRTLMNTLAGTYALLGSVSIKGMRLSAFDKNRIIDEHGFVVVDQPCNYNIILGGDFLQKIGMNLNNKDLSIKWLGNTALMDK